MSVSYKTAQRRPPQQNISPSPMDIDLFADIDLDALLASFSGEPAGISGLIDPYPPPPAPAMAHDAEAGSPESVTSRATPPGEEALTEIERFLMQEGEAELGGEAEGVSVEEFFDALYDGGEGEEREPEGKESEAGGSTDGDSGRDEVVEVVTPEAETVEIDGDDPVSKKRRRCAICLKYKRGSAIFQANEEQRFCHEVKGEEEVIHKGLGDEEQVFGGRVLPPQLRTSVLRS
ncbi:unnamed protein product [Urochloa humidicola]